MARNLIEVLCPCCDAILKVDPETQSVISHTPKPQPKTFNDLEEAATRYRGEAARREEAFKRSVEANRKSADVLNRKFDELLKQAKQSPDEKPLRDFDLD